MYHQKKKKKSTKKSKRKSSNYRSESNSYQADSPLTLHYLTTGAILPEKKED